MSRAVIFDMGGTLMRFVRPGSGSWRELEEPGIRGVYHYLFELAWLPGAWILLGLVVGGAFGAMSSAMAIRRHLREV